MAWSHPQWGQSHFCSWPCHPCSWNKRLRFMLGPVYPCCHASLTGLCRNCWGPGCQVGQCACVRVCVGGRSRASVDTHTHIPGEDPSWRGLAIRPGAHTCLRVVGARSRELARDVAGASLGLTPMLLAEPGKWLTVYRGKVTVPSHGSAAVARG